MAPSVARGAAAHDVLPEAIGLRVSAPLRAVAVQPAMSLAHTGFLLELVLSHL